MGVVADRPLRIVVVGDELVSGAGDPKGLGWVGRVAARTLAPVAPMFLTLPVPGEGTAGLGARWEAEAARLVSAGARLVRRDAMDGDDYGWIVMADPEGNLFCVSSRGRQTRGPADSTTLAPG